MAVTTDVAPKRKPYGVQRKTSRAKEVSIEAHLRDQVQRTGGYCIKLPAGLYVGIPDRLVILHDYVIFVELKKPKGGQVEKVQKWWQWRLREMGHHAEILRTKDEVDKLLRDFE
jgi:hypothetical protein